MGSFDRPVHSDEKFIFDVDTGSDDALAIFLALRNEKYKQGPPLIAITCVYGTTMLKNVVKNTLRTLAKANRCDIPVYIGSEDPIMKNSVVSYLPNSDGFGNFYNPNEFSIFPAPCEENAVSALIRLVNQYPGDITLFAMGPLTNIALALELDPHFILKLNKLLINGGCVPVGYQQLTPSIEFNFFLDPEAVSIVLAHSNYRGVTVLLWDQSAIEHIALSWRKNVFGALNREDIIFLNKAEYLGGEDHTLWKAPNTLSFASHICPFILDKIEPLKMNIHTENNKRGLLWLDYSAHRSLLTNCNISAVLEIDLEEFQSQLLHYFEYN